VIHAASFFGFLRFIRGSAHVKAFGPRVVPQHRSHRLHARTDASVSLNHLEELKLLVGEAKGGHLYLGHIRADMKARGTVARHARRVTGPQEFVTARSRELFGEHAARAHRHLEFANSDFEFPFSTGAFLLVVRDHFSGRLVLALPGFVVIVHGSVLQLWVTDFFCVTALVPC